MRDNSYMNKETKIRPWCHPLSDWVQLSASNLLTPTVQLGPLYLWKLQFFSELLPGLL